MAPTSEMPMTQGNMACGVGTISLATLIDFIVQRTYHDLVVLSEILPRKTDMERKVEIVTYASRTRQLFIRLLALVKWANSASKVDKCVEICNFLEQQSMFFVETADFMARMSRETLVNARLPNFSLPCAIDVLTRGTYPRLPKCIREKIVPPDPITSSEKKSVLQRLNQVIQYRLVSCELPQHMRKLKIENGRVKFLVENEFQVTLTLMEDSPVIPWRLLDIDILVEDHETGDGKALVHTLQVGYIHRVAQSRLLDNDKPLHDLYRVLHSFCQSLQLEVLNSQSQKLIRERLRDSLYIEEYSVGKCLTVSYWRDLLKKDKDKSQDTIRYKLSVHVNEEDDGKQLCLSHTPAMLPDECRRIGLTIHSEHLSIEKLLMQTIEVRTRAKLKELSYSIQRFIEGKCEIRDMPLALHVPVVYPCMSSEQLRITIDAQRGMLLASLPSIDLPVLQDLEETLNGDRKNIQKNLVKLRLQLTILRCEKSVNTLHTVARHHLPLVNQSEHAINDLPKHRLYITVPKQTNYHVVVSVEDSPPRSVEFQYHLLETVPCLGEGMEWSEDVTVKSFLKAGKLVPIDTYAFTNGPYTDIYKESDETDIERFHRKRKVLLGEYCEPSGKKQKRSPYFVPELVHLVAGCEERLPFVYLGQQLKEQGVLFTNIQVDKEAMSLVMDIVQFPDVAGMDKEDCLAFKRNLLSCKMRIVTKPLRCWLVEFLFTNSGLKSQSPLEAGVTQRVLCMYEFTTDSHQNTVVKDMLDDWVAMCQLFSIVRHFTGTYNDPQTGLQKIIQVKSYSYRKISLLYGQGYTSLVNILWKCDKKQFMMSFGRQGQASSINPHVAMTTQLQHDLNTSRSLTYVAQVLHDTWSPMNSLQKLSSAVLMGVGTNPKLSTQSFTIIPQSSTHVRISYRTTYCLDVHFRSNNVVAVRDGAYSLFDTSKATEGFNPIPLLKAFLGMFVDDSVTGGNVRRRSTTEDDNPPSPISGMELDVFNLSQSHGSTGSPGPRSRTDQIAPSPSTFIGTPSPSTILAAGSPGNPQLHVPSPGSFVPAPSPSSLGIHMQSPASSFISPQGMGESGSPYPANLAMPSPGQRNWPNSPSVQGPSPASRHGMVASPGHPTLHSPQMGGKDDHTKASVMSPPSRILPQRQWAASTPTLLSHEAFDKLLKPSPLQQLPYHAALAPLERFLGCKFIRRHIVRAISNQEKNLISIPTQEVGVNMFKGESLQFRFLLNTTTLQSLHMKIQPLPEYKDQWSQEEVQIFEKYFDLKVACPPYKPNSLTGFSRLLKANISILKDVIQIMRLELMPNQDRNLKWSIQLLLTVPPTHAHMAPAGTPAVVVFTKMILMVQLTRLQPPISQQQQPQQQSEPISITVPLLYNIQENTITLVEKGNVLPSPIQVHVIQHLKRFMDRFHSSQECAIYPAVKDLLTNLVLPA